MGIWQKVAGLQGKNAKTFLEMKNSVLYRMVSVFANAMAAKPMNYMTVYDWLCLTKYDVEVAKIRVTAKVNPAKAREMKKALPCVTISGTFAHRSNDGLLKHSGLICIDIDGKDNPEYTTAELKEVCSFAPWVAYAGESVSGNGVFAVIPIAYSEKHLEHFRAIQRDFEDFGIRIDAGCSEVSRLRFYSWDKQPYWNHEAETYERLWEVERKPVQLPRETPKEGTEAATLRMIDEIQRSRVDITGGNKDWFNIGCSLASEFGESGQAYFHAVSQFYQTDRHRYSEEETDKMFTRCLRHAKAYTIATFFRACADHGIMAKKTA